MFYYKFLDEKTKQLEAWTESKKQAEIADLKLSTEQKPEQAYNGKWYLSGHTPAPTVAEAAATEIAELKRKLSDTDYAVIKIAEGAATPEEYADIIGQRATWRARINELEAELGR